MGFRCELTDKISGPGIKPIVVTYYIKKEYHWDSYISHGREIVKEILVLPEEAPEQREILLDGIR